MNYLPSCFIIMPFGTKKGKEGIDINFDEVYDQLLRPAVEAAELNPIRADEEETSGIIHKAMYERLILCDYAVADLSTGNANVYYELGMRHTLKPHTTLCMMSNKTRLEFDLNLNRAYVYEIGEDGKILNAAHHIKQIAQRLSAAKSRKTTDSPVHQLVEGIQFENSLAHEKTDIFRDRVMYESKIKEALADIRNHRPAQERLEKLNQYLLKLQPYENQETGVLIDVMLSYRAIAAWAEMVSFVEALPEYVYHTQMVQEQYGFALNRNKQRDKAIRILQALIEKNGANPETNGILGRVYKDLAEEHGENQIQHEAYLEKSKNTYLTGFEADMRDAYPGINAVSLMALTNDHRYHQLVPVVEMAVLQKMKQKKPDYWDYATLFELAVIANDAEKARRHLTTALSYTSEDWMLQTTKKNVEKIVSNLEKQNHDITEIKAIVNHL